MLGLNCLSVNGEKPGQPFSDLFQGLKTGRKGTADHLFRTLYPELRRLASARMRREGCGHSWQPTLLVNELYLELLKNKVFDNNSFTDERKAEFLSLAGFLMHRLLIVHSRPLRQRVTEVDEPVFDDLPANTPSPESALFVEGLLARIEEVDPKLRHVVEMRVFEGKSNEEIAAQLGCTTRSVTNWWAFARQWLGKELERQV